MHIMRTKIILFSQLLFLIFLIGCKVIKSRNNSIEGIWKSIGYGKILIIDADSYEYFDITDFSCLPVKKGNILELGNSMHVTNDTLIEKLGMSKYHYVRIKKLPELFNQNIKDKNNISYNFEVFANTFKNHYAYFNLNKIDWDSLYINSKNKINSKSTAVDLYFVMKDMIEKLKDNHGSIDPTNEVYESAENQIQPKWEIIELFGPHFYFHSQMPKR